MQAGVAGPLPGQNSLPGPALVQTQSIISTVRAQPQVISNNIVYMSNVIYLAIDKIVDFSATGS